MQMASISREPRDVQAVDDTVKESTYAILAFPGILLGLEFGAHGVVELNGKVCVHGVNSWGEPMSIGMSTIGTPHGTMFRWDAVGSVCYL